MFNEVREINNVNNKINCVVGKVNFFPCFACQKKKSSKQIDRTWNRQWTNIHLVYDEKCAAVKFIFFLFGVLNVQHIVKCTINQRKQIFTDNNYVFTDFCIYAFEVKKNYDHDFDQSKCYRFYWQYLLTYASDSKEILMKLDCVVCISNDIITSSSQYCAKFSRVSSDLKEILKANIQWEFNCRCDF